MSFDNDEDKRLQENLDDLKREDDKLIMPSYSFSDAVQATTSGQQ